MRLRAIMCGSVQTGAVVCCYMRLCAVMCRYVRLCTCRNALCPVHQGPDKLIAIEPVVEPLVQGGPDNLTAIGAVVEFQLVSGEHRRWEPKGTVVPRTNNAANAWRVDDVFEGVAACDAQIYTSEAFIDSCHGGTYVRTARSGTKALRPCSRGRIVELSWHGKPSTQTEPGGMRVLLPDDSEWRSETPLGPPRAARVGDPPPECKALWIPCGAWDALARVDSARPEGTVARVRAERPGVAGQPNGLPLVVHVGAGGLRPFSRVCGRGARRDGGPGAVPALSGGGEVRLVLRGQQRGGDPHVRGVRGCGRQAGAGLCAVSRVLPRGVLPSWRGLRLWDAAVSLRCLCRGAAGWAHRDDGQV